MIIAARLSQKDILCLKISVELFKGKGMFESEKTLDRFDCIHKVGFINVHRERRGINWGSVACKNVKYKVFF